MDDDGDGDGGDGGEVGPEDGRSIIAPVPPLLPLPHSASQPPTPKGPDS
jgi:hypothetical protein